MIILITPHCDYTLSDKKGLWMVSGLWHMRQTIMVLVRRAALMLTILFTLTTSNAQNAYSHHLQSPYWNNIFTSYAIWSPYRMATYTRTIYVAVLQVPRFINYDYHNHIPVPLYIQTIQRTMAFGRLQYIQQPPLAQIPYVNAHSHYIPIQWGRTGPRPVRQAIRYSQQLAPPRRTVYMGTLYVPWQMTERLEHQWFRREIINYLQDR